MNHVALRPLWVACICLTLAACGTEWAEESRPSNLATQKQETRFGNGLKTAALVRNALSAGIASNVALSTQPLSTYSFEAHPDLRLPLVDPDARSFMRYLVGCALAPWQRVEWKHPVTSALYRYRGELGLCPEW